MADLGSGGDHGPVFVDVYGTGRRLGLGKDGGRPGRGQHGFEGPHPEGPFWKRALQGRVPLWMIFWGGFFFGHGIVLALTVGALLIAVTFGMTLDPERVDESITAAWMFGGAVAALMSVFVVWAVISVWRCAPNAEDVKWTYAARGAVALYVFVWAYTIWNIAA